MDRHLQLAYLCNSTVHSISLSSSFRSSSTKPFNLQIDKDGGGALGTGPDMLNRLPSLRSQKIVVHLTHLCECFRFTLLDKGDKSFSNVAQPSSSLSQLLQSKRSVSTLYRYIPKVDFLTSQTETRPSVTVSMIFSLIGWFWSRCLMMSSALNTRRLNKRKQEIASFSVLKNASGR